jgi:hypothetical protein
LAGQPAIWSRQSGFALPWGNVIYYGNPDDIVLPLDQRTPDHWFNVANFETNSSKQLLGNQVRTWPLRFSQIRGPRQNNVDLAIIKQTRNTEGRNLEFRAEALNARNHPYFPNPSMSQTTAQTIKDTGFGQIGFYPEQLCPPAPAQPALLVLNPVPTSLGAGRLPPALFLGLPRTRLLPRAPILLSPRFYTCLFRSILDRARSAHSCRNTEPRQHPFHEDYVACKYQNH